MKAAQILLQIIQTERNRIDYLLEQQQIQPMSQESYYNRTQCARMLESSASPAEFGVKNLAKTQDDPAVVQASYSSGGYVEDQTQQQVQFQDADEIKDCLAADMLESDLIMAHSGVHGSPQAQMAVSRIDYQTSLKAKQLQTPVQFSSPGVQ